MTRVLAVERWSRGGTAEYARDLVEHLASTAPAGATLQLLVPRDYTPVPPRVETLRRLPSVRPRFRAWLPNALVAVATRWAQERATARWVRATRPDVVHLLESSLHSRRVARAASRAGSRLVVTVHDLPLRAPWYRPDLRVGPGRRSFVHADAVIVHGEWSRRRLAASRWGRDARATVIVPGFTDGGSREPLPDGDRTAPGAEVPQVLFVGSPRRNKGLDVALRGLAQVDGGRAHLLVVAPPSSRRDPPLDAYRRLAARLGVADDVTWIGEFLPDRRLDDVVARADAVLVPYRRTFTGQSSVLMRAAALGVPVIGSDHGEIGDAIRRWDLGATFEPESAGGLAECLRTLPMRPRTANGRRLPTWDEAARHTWALYDLRAKRREVALVLSLPTPYRDPLLERLGTELDLGVRALYCTRTDPNRSWQHASTAVASEVLPGVAFGSRSRLTRVKVNPGILGHLERARPDVVVVGGYSLPTMQLAMLWCRRRRVPYLLLCESHELGPPGRLHRLGRAVGRWAVRGASGGLATSSAAARYLESLGAPPERVEVFPNAPDVAEFGRRAEVAAPEREALRRRLGAGAETVVLYVGRLLPAKGLPTLVRAVADLRARRAPVRLVVAGEGPEETRLRGLATALGLADTAFTGPVANDDLAPLYVAADVFVLPSVREPFGVVVLEALACGLPVVVSDRVGSGPDLVNATTGAIVPAGNAGAFADAILDVASRHRVTTAAACRAVAREFDQRRCVRAFQRLLNRVVDA